MSSTEQHHTNVALLIFVTALIAIHFTLVAVTFLQDNKHLLLGLVMFRAGQISSYVLAVAARISMFDAVPLHMMSSTLLQSLQMITLQSNL